MPTQTLTHVALFVVFAVFFAFGRSHAENRMPNGKIRTRRQQAAFRRLILANCLQAIPAGLLVHPFGEIARLDLNGRLILAAWIGWFGLEKTMTYIDGKVKTYGSNSPQNPAGLAGGLPGADHVPPVQEDQQQPPQ